MKALFHFTAPLLALITMIACTELEVSENPQNSNNELLQKLSITGKDFKFDGKTRSSVNIGESGASFTWDEDDVIGIFPDKGDQVSFAMDEGAGTQTATFSGGGWALKSSAKYAAYYPHVYENRDLTAIPVSYVGQTQNGNGNTDHIGAYDFMAAGVSTPENGAVAFDMQHLGVLVQLTITIDRPSTVNKIVLNSSAGFTKTGIIDLTAEKPSIASKAESNTLEIFLNNATTTKADKNLLIYFMTAPVDLTDSELTATIHFDNETTCDIKLTGKNLQAGKAYRLAAEVKLLTDYIDEYGVNHGKGTEIDGVVWAPVNCGYHKTDFKYGKLYQWGRKYGQGYNGDLYGTNKNVIGTYSDATHTPTINKSTSISLSEVQLKSNENVFYGGGHMFWGNDYLWNSGTDDNPVKTEYDPCPDGWRVPTYTELNELKNNRSSFTTYNNQNGHWLCGSNSYTENTSKVFFPAAGFLYEFDATANNRGYYGIYWSSKPFSSLRAHYLIFDNGNACIMTNGWAKETGGSVRCVQE